MEISARPAISGEKTARRVLKLLDFISRQSGAVTAKTVARHLDVSLPTAYNLLNSLIGEGYIERVEGRKGYRLGPMIALLYKRSLIGGDLVSDVQPVLEDLAERTGQRTYLALFDEGEVTVAEIKQMPGSPKLREQSPGFEGAAHALALGKVLLANSSREELEAYKDSHPLKAFTSHTITDPSALDLDLNCVKNTGIATDLEEFSHGLCCIAAPIYNGTGQVEASVAISTTRRRYRAEARCFTTLILRAAREASLLRGYQVSDGGIT